MAKLKTIHIMGTPFLDEEGVFYVALFDEIIVVTDRKTNRFGFSYFTVISILGQGDGMLKIGKPNSSGLCKIGEY